MNGIVHRPNGVITALFPLQMDTRSEITLVLLLLVFFFSFFPSSLIPVVW